MGNNVREAAVEVLVQVEKQGAYSNLLINSTIEKNRFSSLDASLLTELCYGTMQRRMTLDFFLKPFIKKQKRIDPWVQQLLRISVYQFVFLDKIPDHAIIHQAVNIAKRRGNKGISGFINGVLRSIQREGVPSFDTIQDPIERLSIETSHPIWLVKRWVDQYGFDITRQMCEENLDPSKQTARVNTLHTTVDCVLKELEREGFHVEKSRAIPEAIKSVRGNLVKSKAFQKGSITIQDESSMIVAYCVAPKENEKILDTCAAPGGKTTHMAEKMNNQGEIFALDIHKHKIKLIQENAKRLHITNIHTRQMDAREVGQQFEKESFDRILVDAPCSGLGVLKGKPEIKYSKTEEDIKRLAKIQINILQSAAQLVKPGGILVYSTCTVDKEENEGVAKKFLQLNPDFIGDTEIVDRVPEKIKPFVREYDIELLPQNLHSDGFYIACFRKKR